jgi:hypothetical protein
MGKIERIQVSPEDRERLVRLVRDRNTTQKIVWRSQIVLLAVVPARDWAEDCPLWGRGALTPRRQPNLSEMHRFRATDCCTI